MSLADLVGWLGVAIGVCVNLPQAWRIWRRRSCQDVSVWTYRLLLAAVLCYLAHAYSIGAWVFVVSNSITACVTTAVLVLHWRYSRSAERGRQ